MGHESLKSKVRVSDIRLRKAPAPKIVSLTVYDYPTARVMDTVDVDIMLVGDSLGMVVLGYPDTTHVTMAEMCHHTSAVARARPSALILGDLPYQSYSNAADAVLNSRKLIEVGADAIKLEGGASVVPQILALRKEGIEVCGHVGLTPQSIHELGGYKVQGRTAESARKLLEDAKALEQSGVFAVVIECVPSSLAQQITGSISIPTIGIGAGAFCDGQVLVTPDLLGVSTWFKAKYLKRYANLAEEMRSAFAAYAEDVRSGKFPGDEHSFH